MANTEFSKQYYKKMFNTDEMFYGETDPEFSEFFSDFAFDEVINEKGVQLEDKTRFIAILATLIGCQGIDMFKKMIKAALNYDVTPVEIKEIIYQAVAYCGIGRVLPFIEGTNEVFKTLGINLPLKSQSNVTSNNQLEKGIQAQVDIFGESMKDFYKSGPTQTVHINRWLASNCFGTYYTRSGLDYNQREMITLCFLAAQGGCESQLTSHAAANIKIGNDKSFLIGVVSQCMPYIGYPRTLNALNCIKNAAENMNK